VGAWGIGNFDNDDASDWVYELEKAEGISFVEATLETITHSEEEYLEASACARALAAAEVVSALKNAAGQSLPDTVKQWISSYHGSGERDYVQLALKAVERIRTNSELKELWDESDNATEWRKVLHDLEKRLKQ
jgi:hypothetical protein